MQKRTNDMRIITGQYKGRHFDIPRTFKARPTTDFAKENIFNVLTAYLDWEDAEALDLFSGTGSISLELVSRGCRHVVSVEADRDHHAFIKQCLLRLGTDRCVAIRGDVFRFLKSCHQQFDFIFADPPYALPKLTDIPDLVLNEWRPAEGGRHLRVRARQAERLLHPSALPGAPQLRQRELHPLPLSIPFPPPHSIASL